MSLGCCLGLGLAVRVRIRESMIVNGQWSYMGATPLRIAATMGA
jgi:hypothetical protein